MPALAHLIDTLGATPTQAEGLFRADCPTHGRKALSIDAEARNGRGAVMCVKGCRNDAIVDALEEHGATRQAETLRDWLSDMDAPEYPTDDPDPRPEADITNPGLAADWLRTEVGRGPLAGLFARDSGMVFTPLIGEGGYNALTQERGNHDGPAQVRPVDSGILAARVQHTYRVVRRDARTKRRKPALFPSTIAATAVNAVDMMPHLRHLSGITHTPTVRADGTVLDTPGYDPASGLLYLPEPGLAVPAVPSEPTPAQLAEATALVSEMVAGFPFVSDHDKANFWAALLTPLLRHLIPPPYKMIAIGAPQPGSGKSLLAAILRSIHGGVLRSETPEDGAEMRKQISSILDVTTAPVVEFDNVTGVLRSSVLAGLLTAKQWDDRRLGGNTMVSRPNDRLWVITGNNLTLGGDLVRRTLWVTIDPQVPNPERRTGFAIPNLEVWVAEHRGPLVQALLVLIRSWIVAGQPTAGPRGSDSFARWMEVTNGIIAHAGVAGVVGHDETARQTVGADDDEWATFLAAAERVFGDRTWTAKELLAKVDTRQYGDGGEPGHDGWAATHPIELGDLPGELAERVARSRGNASVAARSLGMWLKNRDGRWAGRLAIRSAGKNRADAGLWRVERAAGAGTAGTTGTSSHPRVETRSRNDAKSHGRRGNTPDSPGSPCTCRTCGFDGGSVGLGSGGLCAQCEIGGAA